MSAYVVDDKVINSIVSFLSTDRRGDWLRDKIKEETGCDLTTFEGRCNLGKAMFELNCNAVDQRYGKDSASQFRPLDYEFTLDPMVHRLSAYKQLKCWQYQCSEGDVPSTSLLYAAMDRVKGELADDIVSSLSQYEQAPGW